jgi:argininosuccinate synthase
MNTAWSGEDVRGFSKIFGNQIKIYHSIGGVDGAGSAGEGAGRK